LVFEAGRRAQKPPSRDVGARRNAFGPIDGIDLASLVKTHWSRVEVLITSGRPVSNTVLPDGVRFTSKPWSRKDVLKLARAAVAKALLHWRAQFAALLHWRG
jgi:hypothetical protein